MNAILKLNIENFIIKEKVNITNISERSGVSISTLSRILSGEIKKPSRGTMEQLSKAFGTPISKLLNDDLYDDEVKNEDKNHHNIKERVLYLMKKSRLNIDSFVSLTNVSHGSIRSIISGETKKPNLETCTKIANFFGITIKQLKCEDILPIDDDLYKDIPVIKINNVKKWVETKNDFYIESFKNFLIHGKINIFCVEIVDNSFVFEYEIGDRLIIELTNEIGIGKYVAEINSVLNLYHIYNNDNIIKYRLIGSMNKLSTEINNIKIFGKLIEVKVN